MSRDDFTSKTKEILAKRVGFICSNPDCKRVTIGPQEESNKIINIGIAAHITAASAGGPRSDSSLKPEQRSHIDNGIWLCPTCASIIDRDTNKFDRKLLIKWKLNAEDEQRIKIESVSIAEVNNSLPYLEADLIFSNGLATPGPYSQKNEIEIGNNGVKRILNKSPILFWELNWEFVILIHNNSSIPAINVNLKPNGNLRFRRITELNRINNIQPFENIEIRASFSFITEETGFDAKNRIKQEIPDEMVGLEIDIEYFDEKRKLHCTNFSISENKEISNIKK